MLLPVVRCEMALGRLEAVEAPGVLVLVREAAVVDFFASSLLVGFAELVAGALDPVDARLSIVVARQSQ